MLLIVVIGVVVCISVVPIVTIVVGASVVVSGPPAVNIYKYYNTSFITTITIAIYVI